MSKLKKIFEIDWYFRKYVAIVEKLNPQKAAELRLSHKVRQGYYLTAHRKLRLYCPKTFDDKLWWLALYWQHPLKTQCADKYLVREYVRQKGCADILIPMLGVYGEAESIPFDELPNQCVFKCNHGCGYNIIVKDKSSLDIVKTRKQLDAWMKETYGECNNELHYRNIQPRIICEEFLPISNGLWQIDYKIHCANGKPLFVLVCYDRDENQDAQLATFSLDWQQAFLVKNEKSVAFSRPASLEKMILYASILSAEFPFVRVDFYEVDGLCKFGELTFTPYGNAVTYFTNETQLMLGQQIKLPERLKP